MFCFRSVWVVLKEFTLYGFFLIATAIPHNATNGLYRTQWKCSHYVTVTTSPTPIQPIMSKNKSQSQIVQCERALKRTNNVITVIVTKPSVCKLNVEQRSVTVAYRSRTCQT